MVMPVGSMKFRCQKCSWSRVINQRSDVILGPRVCPECGDVVQFEKASLLDKLMSLGGMISLSSGKDRNQKS